MNTIIECENISKSFNNINVLKNINLEIYEKEILMLVGPSGCGKTTLISIISSILQYDSGNLRVLNKNYKNMNDKELMNFRSLSLGFIYQSFNLFTNLPVIYNIMIPLLILKENEKTAFSKACELLNKIGLYHARDKTPNQLSGGEQQRVAIIRSLIHEPKLLICDEPTSALDQKTGTQILEMMLRLNENKNTTIIIVTHDSRIYSYANRVIHINDGSIIDISKN